MTARTTTSKRVVLCGAPLAGKTEILRRVAAVRGAIFDRYAVPGTTSGTFYSVPRTRSSTDGSSFELLALPGVYVEPTLDARFIASGDAIVLVLDPQIERLDANRYAIESMMSAHPSTSLGVVMFTKQDLRGKASFVEPSTLLANTAAAEWPVFFSRIDEPQTLLTGVDWTISRLLEPSAS